METISLLNQSLATNQARTEALRSGITKARKSAYRREAYGTGDASTPIWARGVGWIFQGVHHLDGKIREELSEERFEMLSYRVPYGCCLPNGCNLLWRFPANEQQLP